MTRRNFIKLAPAITAGVTAAAGAAASAPDAHVLKSSWHHPATGASGKAVWVSHPVKYPGAREDMLMWAHTLRKFGYEVECEVCDI